MRLLLSLTAILLLSALAVAGASGAPMKHAAVEMVPPSRGHASGQHSHDPLQHAKLCCDHLGMTGCSSAAGVLLGGTDWRVPVAASAQAQAAEAPPFRSLSRQPPQRPPQPD